MSKASFRLIAIHCGDAGACVILKSSNLSWKYWLLEYTWSIAFWISIIARSSPWYIFNRPECIWRPTSCVIELFCATVIMMSRRAGITHSYRFQSLPHAFRYCQKSVLLWFTMPRRCAWSLSWRFFFGKRTGQHRRIDDDSRICIVGIPGCILEPSETS